VRRGTGVRGLGALAAVLGSSMLVCASASARTAQTITFTSNPPSQAVAGGSYEVSGTASSGLPVALRTYGDCSLTKPEPDRPVHLEMKGPYSLPPPTGGPVALPAVVYFNSAEECSLDAEVETNSQYDAARASQHFPIGIDPSEQITFISTPPSHVHVDEPPYDLLVLSSAGIDVFLSSATPSVCELPLGEEQVFFLREGTCTIAASQRPRGVAEAQQSFIVSAWPNTLTLPISTVTTETDAQTAPATSNTTAATPKRTLTPATKLKKPLKACEKDKNKRKRRRCQASARHQHGMAKTPNALSATLVIHVHACGGPIGTCSDWEDNRLELTRLGPNEEAVSSIVAQQHTVHVDPGRYKIRILGGPGSSIVVVKAGQVLEVLVEINEK
jgi:hypothetical protein